jgi:acetylornithine deacetylase/succinyl-diaminopimelate desuccinylase-like protein
MGFAQEDENFHAPNEHFHLENFDLGLRTLYSYWFKLAKVL